MTKNKSFADIVFSCIGKKVQIRVIVADNPPYTVDGTLEEVNSEFILLKGIYPIEDNDMESKIFINMKVSSISSIEVFA